jgi:glycosyltransferase involved in cell wall biosynthesis
MAIAKLNSSGVVTCGLSIIIPAKQEQETLARCLRSINEQRMANALDVQTVVVVAAGDQETMRCASAADIAQFDMPGERPTIAMARNLGVSLSTGKYLLHIDADVILLDLPAVISSIGDALGGQRHCGWTSQLWPHPEEARRMDRAMHQIGAWVIRMSIWYGMPLVRGECMAMARVDFDEISGFREDLYVGEDCDFFIRLSRTSKKSVYFERQHPVFHSVRRFRAWGYRRFIFRVLRECLAYIRFRRTRELEWECIR